MASETPEEEAELMLMMEEFQKQQELKKQLEKEKEEGKMASGYKLNDFELNRGVYESMGIKLYNLIDDPEAGSFQEHEVREMIYGGQYASGGRVKYGDGTDKNKYNFMDLIDTKAEDEYYKTKEELLDRKYNAKNYPPSQRNMSMEELKKMLDKAKKDKEKRAKGGIAGVL